MWSGHKAGGLVGWSKQGKWILLSKVYQWCAWNCRAQWSQCRMSGLYLQLPKVFSCEECSSSRIHTTSRRCIKMCENLPKMWSLNLSWINKPTNLFSLTGAMSKLKADMRPPKHVDRNRELDLVTPAGTVVVIQHQGMVLIHTWFTWASCHMTLKDIKNVILY